jgi:mono/diheme cytochrome c family protein
MKIVRVLRSLPLVLLTVFTLGSPSRASDPANGTAATGVVVAANPKADAMRVEGEQRFRANCGRCHAAPHKFPPRVMATVVRHMRVRATITDEDMRLILFYMTE